jgi:hypothetical protein
MGKIVLECTTHVPQIMQILTVLTDSTSAGSWIALVFGLTSTLLGLLSLFMMQRQQRTLESWYHDFIVCIPSTCRKKSDLAQARYYESSISSLPFGIDIARHVCPGRIIIPNASAVTTHRMQEKEVDLGTLRYDIEKGCWEPLP